jgi:glycosyltransferase involved in cell wall biosynthesis
MRVLILSRTSIGPLMSSPGIRYLNLRRVLREALPGAEVTLAAPRGQAQPGAEHFDVVYYDPVRVLSLVRSYDVVVSMSFPLSLALAAPFLEKPIFVLDFFSQFYLEWIEVGRDLYSGLHRRLWTLAGQLYANFQLALADYVLCANERQRDSYIGVLASLGRLTPATYDADPTLRRLIDVAPHGVRPEPFPRGPGGVKGRYPGIEAGDKLLLWLGGILYWYDPITLLHALARVRQKHPEVKLLFLGAVYPGSQGTNLGQGLRFRETVAEAKRLGLWNTGVFIHEEWLPYEAVVDYLRDADLAVTTYFTNAETRFAYRTRFLDYIWARVPIVCTEGDVLADEVRARGWGVAVAEKDVEGLAAAITRLIDDEAFNQACRERLGEAAAEITWEGAFAPLVRFLAREGGPKPIAAPRGRRRLGILRGAAGYLAVRVGERVVARFSESAGEK